MSWISVDTKIIGGQLRSLYKMIGCSQHEALGILMDLWIWGVNNTDQDGLIISADKTDIENAIRDGLQKGINPEDVFCALLQTGWIISQDDKYYISDWNERISYYQKYNKDRAAHSERMKRYREKHTDGDAKSDVTSDVTQKQASKYGPEFEAFWAAYPRKADKGQAYKKYMARRGDGFSAYELLSAAQNYKKACEIMETETQYIKHAKTFLADSLPFTEYINAVPAAASKKKNTFINFDQRQNDYEEIQSKLIKKSFQGGNENEDNGRTDQAAH